LQDANQQPANISAHTLHLDTDSAGGVFSKDAAGTEIITTLSVPVGATSATFFYKDTRADTPTLTVSETGALTVATQSETVTAAPATNLIFSTQPPIADIKAGDTFSVAVSAIDA